MRRVAEIAGLVDLLATLVGLVWWGSGRLPADLAAALYAVQTAGAVLGLLAVVAAVLLAVVALRPQRTPPWHS
jgi:hypothetical protein